MLWNKVVHKTSFRIIGAYNYIWNHITYIFKTNFQIKRCTNILQIGTKTQVDVQDPNRVQVGL